MFQRMRCSNRGSIGGRGGRVIVQQANLRVKAIDAAQSGFGGETRLRAVGGVWDDWLEVARGLWGQGRCVRFASKKPYRTQGCGTAR